MIAYRATLDVPRKLPGSLRSCCSRSGGGAGHPGAAARPLARSPVIMASPAPPRTATWTRSSRCSPRSPGSAPGAGAGPGRGVLARDPGWEDHPGRPVQGAGCQHQRRGHRPVVLGEGPCSRRQRPGGMRAGRVPAVGLGRGATSPPPASTPCLHCTTPPQRACPLSPIPAMTARASASSSRSSSPSAGGHSMSIPAPANAIQRSLRCPGERGFALLNQRWRTLQHITASPARSATSPAPHSA